MSRTISRRVAALAAFALALAGSCLLHATEPAEDPDRPNNPDMSYRLDPIQYLQWLTTAWPGRWPETFWTPVKGWIKEEHIPRLIELLDSDEPCTPVVDSHSSNFPNISTVGAEAAMMIAGFRKGIYPPALQANKYDLKDREEMRRWWKLRQAAPAGAN